MSLYNSLKTADNWNYLLINTKLAFLLSIFGIFENRHSFGFRYVNSVDSFDHHTFLSLKSSSYQSEDS